MAKIKLHRASDGAVKEFTEKQFTPFMKEAHMKKGFRIVNEIPAKEEIVNKEKPVPVIPNESAEGDAPETEESAAEETAGGSELEEMTVKELRAKAKEEGVENYGSMKKADLIESLS